MDADVASKDVEITIPLSKLHTVRGQVILKTTGQAPPNASVVLGYADTQEIVRVAMAPDGAFEFHYVPEDKFTVTATAIKEPPPKILDPDAEDVESGVGAVSGEFSYSVNPRSQAPAGSAAIPLVVTGDVDHLIIAIPDPSSGRQNQNGISNEGETPALSPAQPQ